MDKVKEVWFLCFKLGLFAFGGPAAHIAMLHGEVVDKRKWMSDKHFLDLVGLTALIPGPNSTEMVIHSGFHRAGVAGLFISGISFILPATVLTLILAYLYVELSGLPNFDQYIVGIKPVVMILIFDALRKLWKKAITEKFLIAIAVIVFGLGFFGVAEAIALLIGAVIGFWVDTAFEHKKKLVIEPISIFLIFAKVGSILFGSGYVLIAYLQDELVSRRGWITTIQLADAIGIGQITPGPVLSTSTFIGYLVGSYEGAILATIGIFLPSFLFVWILNPFLPRMQKSKVIGKFLKSINAGVIGMMAYALVPLGEVTLVNPVNIILLALLIGIYLKFKKLSSIKLLIIGTFLGLALHQAIALV